MSTTEPGTAASSPLPLTGERTMPGIAEENYWFRRHEAAYELLAPRCAGARMLEAGCGEGYGAALLAARGARLVLGLDRDAATAAHAAARYRGVRVARANLAHLPLPDGGLDVVVTLQVIEHLADQAGFLAECFRVLRPGGSLLVSTPNRITFSPGRVAPLNPFHTRELTAGELAALLAEAGFRVREMLGLRHGPALRALDTAHGGSLIDAQITVALRGGDWPPGLLADVASVRTGDFEIRADRLDESLDLVAVADRPAERPELG